MKKTLILLLALALIVSLAACGQQAPKGTLTTQTPAAESTDTPAEPTDAPAEVEDDPMTASVTIGNRYENPSLGIGVELDADWHIFNEDELAQLSGLTAEMFSDEKYQEMAKSVKNFYDFYAMNSSSSNINILFENLGLLYGTLLDEEQYRDLAYPSMEAAYADAGFTDIIIEKNTVVFAGAERTGIFTQCKSQGIEVCMQQVLIKTGKHMAIITIAGSTPEALQSTSDLFFALD
ncbi:MAG: hypothetical protein IKI69_06735 [Oscillospiraceae bacterium]|nr:hypothetical protein [Oscillospiraceae bacterium]